MNKIHASGSPSSSNDVPLTASPISNRMPDFKPVKEETIWVIYPERLTTGGKKRFERFMEKLKHMERERAVVRASNQPPPELAKIGESKNV